MTFAIAIFYIFNCFHLTAIQHLNVLEYKRKNNWNSIIIFYSNNSTLVPYRHHKTVINKFVFHQSIVTSRQRIKNPSLSLTICILTLWKKKSASSGILIQGHPAPTFSNVTCVSYFAGFPKITIKENDLNSVHLSTVL